MGTTANFVKLRSKADPKVGEWNINYSKALDLAKKNNKFIVTCWSNGDICGFCVSAEQCMLEKTFQDWMKTKDVYFVFQYSGDTDKGKALHDWIFTKGKVKYYPGFRITKYDANGKIVSDKALDGNTLRGNKTKLAGAKVMITNLDKILGGNQSDKPDTTPEKQEQAYKIRLNEKLTVKKVNAILDAIDKNDGYCPCQAGKSEATKCHCEDFIKNKGLDTPCICNIYVKKAK